MAVKKLSELNPGDSGVIVDTHGEGWLRKRLLDMGVTKSAKVFFKKRAPFGDPIEVNLRGYELSLRKSEAELVDVEVTV
ncbi:MAG: ferrous iron transport protein A [Clostridia bacterium]|nr:ferrous iron transport protein A [Clostridia bacterium]